MEDNKKKIDSIVGEYQYGFITDSKPVMDTGKGISEDIVRQISKIKNEPEWMTEFRVKAYKHFVEIKNPDWGPDLSHINFDEFTYYIKPSEKQRTT